MKRKIKVILVMAMTLDGKIARHSLEEVDWTGSADKKVFVDITKKAGVIIMGSKTFDTIGKVLPRRRNIVMTSNTSRVSNDENLVFSNRTPEEILNELENEGFDSAALIGGSTINGLFAGKKLIDEIYVTVVPKIFGEGLSLFSGALDMELELMDIQKIDSQAILMRYKVN
ncbi:FolA [Desulfamplus magnetovallimortis]|uniref:FolA n=1 Tax=Desulfamplus magnetovallimortis TaxID=1246637 RepID=A0A1W1H6Q8_9BACT|nr:dihydrofolate reductase family protein [Desulfamplus magnetovallimortis]SLM28139.1 FolA [Desulfamplus magnetovallimortis]